MRVHSTEDEDEGDDDDDAASSTDRRPRTSPRAASAQKSRPADSSADAGGGRRVVRPEARSKKNGRLLASSGRTHTSESRPSKGRCSPGSVVPRGSRLLNSPVDMFLVRKGSSLGDHTSEWWAGK